MGARPRTSHEQQDPNQQHRPPRRGEWMNMAPTPKVITAPARKAKVKVTEITEDDRRARTQSNHDEWRKLIQLATTKTLRIECEDYREARTLSQRLTAVRSFYGYDVRIQHRGKEIFLSPREPLVDIESVVVEEQR